MTESVNKTWLVKERATKNGKECYSYRIRTKDEKAGKLKEERRTTNSFKSRAKLRSPKTKRRGLLCFKWVTKDPVTNSGIP